MPRKTHRSALALAAVFGCLLLCSYNPVRAEFVGVLGPNDFVEITVIGEGFTPTAINSQGDIVGQDAGGQAFLWRSGVTTSLGTLGGATSIANDINDNGLIVGRSDLAGGGFKAAQWSVGQIGITNLDPNSALSSEANAVNNNDTIVGYKTNGSINRSSIWSAGNPDGALVFGGGNHQATGISDSDVVVGVTRDGNNDLDEGFFHNGSDPLNGFSGGLGTNYFPLAGVNDDGLTAGIGGDDSALYMRIGDIEATPIPFLGLGDLISSSYGLNNNGIIVGESGMQGFVLDLSTGQTTNINDFTRTGFQVDSIISLNDINDNGVFTGVAQRGSQFFAFSGRGVTAVPEPGLFGLAALPIHLAGCWIVASRRRRMRKAASRASTTKDAQAIAG